MLGIELRGVEEKNSLGEGKNLEISSNSPSNNRNSSSPIINGFSQLRISSENYRKRFSRKSRKIDGNSR